MKRRAGLTSGHAGKRLLSPEEIERAIVEVTALAKKERATVALAGGCAMFVYGSTRLTTGVDFLASKILASLPGGKLLTFGGESTRTPSGVPVDLIVRSDRYERLYDAALDDARTVTFQGTKVRVVTAEHLVALKLVAARPKDELDLAFLVTDGGADVKKARKIVEKHLGFFAADELERDVELAKLLAAREGRNR